MAPVDTTLRKGAGGRLPWLCLLGYWLLLFCATHVPIPVEPRVRVHQLDKLVHLAAFGGLAFLIGWALRVSWPRRAAWVVYGTGLVVAVLYGLVDEWSQSLVAYRTADWRDALANTCGAVAGLSLYASARWGQQLLRPLPAEQPAPSSAAGPPDQ